MAEVARFLVGDDVYLHQSRLNYTPGFTGKEFYWHSDFETWHAEDGLSRPRAVSAWILLTDNSLHASNGNVTPHPRSNACFLYNAVSNPLEAPFAAPKPPPAFLAERGDGALIVPVYGDLLAA